MTKKKPYRWTRLGKIFDPRSINGKPWLREFAQAPSTLIMGDRIRVYFSCRPPPDEFGRYVSYSAYVDLDRNDITKVIDVAKEPILPLGKTGAFDEFGIYPVSAINDGDVIRLFYGGWTRCEAVPFDVAIGSAISHDGGKNFIKEHRGGPVLSACPDEPFIISGPKIRRFNNQWQLFYIAGREWLPDIDRPEPVYRIRMAVSADGKHWLRLGRDLLPPKIVPDEAQASPDVTYHRGIFHMFYCYRRGRNYRGREGGYRIGYAHSRDLINWIRDDAMAGMHVANDGWDSDMQSYPHVFAVDGRFYMLYLGNDVGREGFGGAVLDGEL